MIAISGNCTDFFSDLPAELRAIIERLRSILNHDLVISAILTGSTARGEMSFFGEGSELMVRSDIELCVVSEKPTELRKAVTSPIKALEQQYIGRWPEFHIDISYLTPSRFRRLPLWIRHFELKANGYVITGKNILNQVPEVNLYNLDWLELNEIILWRLLGLVARLPVSWLTHKCELPPWGPHAMARSLLDVTTWGLPGIEILLPTYRQRVQRWGDSDVTQVTKATGFVDERMLEVCLDSRRQFLCQYSDDVLFAVAIETWTKAYDIAVGHKEWVHHGAGRGFARLDPLRLARAALRAGRTKPSLVLATLLRGPSALVAATSQSLALSAFAMRQGDDPSKHILCAARLLGNPQKEMELPVVWGTLRNVLVKYMDAVLGRHEWQRFVPKEDRK